MLQRPGTEPLLAARQTSASMTILEDEDPYDRVKEVAVAESLVGTELQALNIQIVQLGSLVDTSLRHVLDAFAMTDPSLCEQVLAADTLIDDGSVESERRSFQLLKVQRPLDGCALRFLTAVSPMLRDLQQIGGSTTDIATILPRFMSLPDVPIVEEISAEQARYTGAWSAGPNEAFATGAVLTLGREAHVLLQRTMEALATCDNQAARRIWQDGDLIDMRYRLVRRDLLEMLAAMRGFPTAQNDDRNLQRISLLLSMIHILERIADHCAHICEWVVFVFEGEASMTSAH